MPSPSPRYAPTQQLFHWVSALAMFAVLPLAWVAVSLAEETPRFERAIGWHEGLGLLVLLLTVARLIQRRSSRPPDLPQSMRGWNRRAAQATYAGLFVLMIIMPV